MAEFDFTFDPALFPTPPPLPSSADLFSPSETTDLLGFLDSFGEFGGWDVPAGSMPMPPPTTTAAPYNNPHLHTVPERSTKSAAAAAAVSNGTMNPNASQQHPQQITQHGGQQQQQHQQQQQQQQQGQGQAAAGLSRPKPLLSTPQKRLNHIMSEQKRRNAIRDGYAQLISLIAPAGSAVALDMPTRGRPKGSGSRGGANGKGSKGGENTPSKGKSGVLFRAVEYVRWLQECRDALEREVIRVESAAGICK